MRCVRQLPVLLCGIGLLACTRDFDKFEFDSSDGGHDRSSRIADGGPGDAAAPASNAGGSGGTPSPHHARDAGHSNASTDAGSDQTHDAALQNMDAAAMPDTGTTTADAGTPPNDAASGTPDAAPDTSVPDTSVPDDAAIGMCSSEWTSASLPANACSTCACGSCTDPVTACLTNGSAAEAQLCIDVFACALQNDCKDWDCYCTEQKCGAPLKSGDGPCAAQMDAAANGKRTEVMAIREAGDPNQPLVRAMKAIGCVLGLDEHSPGGPKTGRCDATCP
jgi:hypothetical protein